MCPLPAFSSTLSKPEARQIWWLYTIAALSFLPTLWLQYVGEEGASTISSLEMWHQQRFFTPTLYGGNYGRPPLFNWLIIFLANLLGWGNMLVASRLLAALATLFTGVILAWLVCHLSRDLRFAAFAAMVYVTSENVFFHHGWLAYTDPVFSLLVFGSIACLWVASLEKRVGLLWIGSLALVGAFLTKSLTAYVFYFLTFTALVFRQENRSFFLRTNTLLPHLLAIAVPNIWIVYVTVDGHQSYILRDILQKFTLDDLPAYGKQLLTFPLWTFAHLLPCSLAILYFLYRARFHYSKRGLPQLSTVWWVLGMNYVPYWFSPNSHSRYILPLYPLFALIMANAIWRMGDKPVVTTLRCFIVVIALKYIAGLWAFPYYESHFRGDYASVAKDIIARTSGNALYSNDDSAVGLSVTANIDILRHPSAPLVRPPARWESGFVLAHTADTDMGQVAKRYPSGGDAIYLLCRGAACAINVH